MLHLHLFYPSKISHVEFGWLLSFELFVPLIEEDSAKDVFHSAWEQKILVEIIPIYIFFVQAPASEWIVHPSDKFIFLALLYDEWVVLVRYICQIVDLFKDIIAFYTNLAILGADEYVWPFKWHIFPFTR